MIRRLFILSLLSIFFIGCKAKRTVASRSESPKQKKEVVVVKKESKKSDDGLYPMPEDTGKFVRFNIDSPEEYVETFAEIAQMEMKAFGIPASITLAQGLLESGLGKGALALKTNNHFGIKCHTGWEGDYDFHDDDEKGECFRKYNHPMYSYRDHSLFLKHRSRYAFLFDYRSDDYKRWAKGLRQAGYATDRHYPQKLISLIERYELHKYDTEIAKQGFHRPKTEEPVIASRAQSRVHVVQKGDTLYSISRAYSVSVDDLKRWNYMYDNNLAIGQKLTVKTQNFNK
ncbi:glucosaminidase domain-containing protein [Zobellia galactanivorans]|uniref:Peptidoglycan hydrolase n=1 Tax=Zobellia galactanivorans (strain DSM 12802 / CCUG 47099 / CIP 106680 / NCIMB 13871 / Dsij) TaxID=63186 RepID=G0L2J3_ZOBGA|nr:MULTISPECIES: glucosaminidase domain-containing protein [Zobellia]MBU3024573.1 glucosaminidase domain-containing protein [Zobellia galactanivorans]MDO6810842.1 glucosaminidase domain-containing protein [Zobellia galactanivorans]OWW26132.1 N-acetylmuramidase [Zobellia sp. OII3]CAZ95022.1 Endo-beta-N-acetylglucosaminidase, family GH73 [Zobellia galactanivorans]